MFKSVCANSVAILVFILAFASPRAGAADGTVNDVWKMNLDDYLHLDRTDASLTKNLTLYQIGATQGGCYIKGSDFYGGKGNFYVKFYDDSDKPRYVVFDLRAKTVKKTSMWTTREATRIEAEEFPHLPGIYQQDRYCFHNDPNICWNRVAFLSFEPALFLYIQQGELTSWEDKQRVRSKDGHNCFGFQFNLVHAPDFPTLKTYIRPEVLRSLASPTGQSVTSDDEVIGQTAGWILLGLLGKWIVDEVGSASEFVSYNPPPSSPEPKSQTSSPQQPKVQPCIKDVHKGTVEGVWIVECGDGRERGYRLNGEGKWEVSGGLPFIPATGSFESLSKAAQTWCSCK